MSAVIAHVDDDPDIRAAVRAILSAEGYDVATFGQAQPMLDALEKGQLRPDLVILDVMVEKEDSGLTAYDRISAQHPDIPLVILSSLGELILPYFELRQDMVHIVEKPVPPIKLLAVVRAHLRRGGRDRR